MKKFGNKYRPGWDEYFMSLAFDAATRASCEYIKTGSVIVVEKRVIATGYNGAPPGIDKNCLEIGCLKDEARVSQDEKNKGVCIGTHAEMNALLRAGDRAIGGSLYSLMFPCSSCAKHVAAAGIRRVYYVLGYEEKGGLTKEIFSRAGIALTHLPFTEEDLDKLHALRKDILHQLDR